MADTLKFGPEWLRNLSDGTSISAHGQQPSGGLSTVASANRYKLAEHRYGREEMLALYSSNSQPPEELKSVQAIYSEKSLQPLALIPQSDEEQRLLSQSVNSTAALRTNVPRSSNPTNVQPTRTDSGRGRAAGRGRTDGYFQRGPSEDDSFVRNRHSRGESWEEGSSSSNTRGRGFSQGGGGRSFDDTTAPHNEFSRSMSTENWRGTKKWSEDEDNNWRKSSSSQRSSTRSWREPYEKSGDGERGDRREDSYRNNYHRSYSSSSAAYEDDPELPEWSTDDVELGTFDSTGAFMSFKEFEELEKKSSEKQKRNENETRTETAENETKSHMEHHGDESRGSSGEPAEENKLMSQDQSKNPDNGMTDKSLNMSDDIRNNCRSGGVGDFLEQNVAGNQSGDKNVSTISGVLCESGFDDKDNSTSVSVIENNSDASGPTATSDGSSGISLQAGVASGQEMDSEFGHLEQEVENLVNTLSAEEEQMIQGRMTSSGKGFLAQDHEDAKKWFYRDPQGDIQGPFLQTEMAEWFSAGYFSMNLFVKRGNDDQFVQLGLLIKACGGQNPFILRVSPTPLKVSPMSGAVPTSVDVQQQQQQQQQQSEQLKQMLLQQQILQQQQQQQQQQQPRHQQEMYNVTKFQILQQLIQQQQTNRPAGPIEPPSNPALSHRAPSVTQQQTPHFHRSISQPAGIDLSGLAAVVSMAAGSSTTLAGPLATSGGPGIGGGSVPGGSSTNNPGLWRSSSCLPSGVPWNADNNWEMGNMKPPITAQALEQMQYLALEKQQQQQQHKMLQQPDLNDGKADRQQPLDLDQIREIIQQQEQAMRMAEGRDERRRMEERQRIEERQRMEERQRLAGVDPVNMLERQRMEELRRRQEKSDEMRRQQQQTFEFLRLLQDQQAPVKPSNLVSNPVSIATARDHSIEAQARRQAQWAASQRGQQQTSGMSGLPMHLDSSIGAIGHQQDQFSKHLKMNDIKAPAGIWPGTSGNSNWTQDSNWANLSAKGGQQTSSWQQDLMSQSNKISSTSYVPGQPSGIQPSSANNSAVKDLLQLLQQSNKQQPKRDDLTLWCESVLKGRLTPSNIPSFVQHLTEMNTPVEVNNCVKTFLGNTEEAAMFARQYLERRNQSRVQADQQKQAALILQLMSNSCNTNAGSHW